MTIQRRKRRRGVPPTVYEKIEELVALGTYSAAQVHAELERTFVTALVPSLRTVQDIVREVTPPDPSGPWTMTHDEGEAPQVLPVLATVIERSQGARHYLTRAEVSWIVRIRRVVAELPDWATYRLARLYVAREARNQSTNDLDICLAFTPWRSVEHMERYRRIAPPGADEVTRWLVNAMGTARTVDEMAAKLKLFTAAVGGEIQEAKREQE